MHSNKEIRQTAIDTLKSGNINMLMIFVAAFIYIPAFTFFMPPITALLYFAISFFIYPYCKITFQAACGKSIELEDILDFSGFISYVGYQVKLIIKTLPMLLGIGLSFAFMYAVIIDPDWWPFIMGETEENLLFYGSLIAAIILFVLMLIIRIKYRLSIYYIIEGLSVNNAIRECKDDMKGNLFKYITFMLPMCLLLLLSFVLLGFPLIALIPYTLLSESAWYYQLRYDSECKGTYYGDSNSMLTDAEIKQNQLLEQQQQRERVMREQNGGYSNVSLVAGFNSLEKGKNNNIQGQPYNPYMQQPSWPPQQPLNQQPMNGYMGYQQQYPYQNQGMNYPQNNNYFNGNISPNPYIDNSMYVQQPYDQAFDYNNQETTNNPDIPPYTGEGGSYEKVMGIPLE